MRFLSLRSMAFTTLVVVLLPASGEAQFSKIKKAATQSAANAAGVPTSGSPRYVKKIDLTSAQIGQVNKGMQTAIQIGPETIKRWEKAQSSYEKALAEYQKKKEAYDKCIEAEQVKWQAKLDASRKKSDAAGDKVKSDLPTEDAMVAQAKAAQAAMERVSNGTATAADRQTVAEFQKTMGGVQVNANAAMAAMQENSALKNAMPDSIKAKCGAEPKEPTLGASAGAKPGAGGYMPTSATDDITQQSAAAAGMSYDEYRMMLEKTLGFAWSHTQVQGGAETPEDEAKAINQALAQTNELSEQAKKANVPLM